MAKSALAVPDFSERRVAASMPRDGGRVARAVVAHFDFIWRSLRRLGIPEHAVDDATQKVFLVAARKMSPIPMDGERAFLFRVAMRVAAEERRARRRHPDAAGGEELPDPPDPTPGLDELLDRRRAREVLDAIVGEMPLEIGVVFVLSELEEMTAPEIAALLQIPLGTVASRLRRARALFDSAVTRYQARVQRGGAR